MSEDIRKMIDKVKNFKQFVNENKNQTYTMYTGVSLKSWDNIWKNKNLKNGETNVTTDLDVAAGYSYNWDTGEYEDIVVEISNIPLMAFWAYREDDFVDDDDYVYMEEMSDSDKQTIIENKSLFLLRLLPYKDQIKTELIEL